MLLGRIHSWGKFGGDLISWPLLKWFQTLWLQGLAEGFSWQITKRQSLTNRPHKKKKWRLIPPPIRLKFAALTVQAHSPCRLYKSIHSYAHVLLTLFCFLKLLRFCLVLFYFFFKYLKSFYFLQETSEWTVAPFIRDSFSMVIVSFLWVYILSFSFDFVVYNSVVLMLGVLFD